MEFKFSKLHGAGNDFIVVDNSDGKLSCSPFFIRSVCRRHTGIGADGMIYLTKLDGIKADCRMAFYNNDGKPAGMCGNGLRCAAKFASDYMLNLKKKIVIQTTCGCLDTEILDEGLIKVEIPILEKPEKRFPDGKELYFVNTGVPHLVCIKKNVQNIDVELVGRYLRNHSEFKPDGVNVDFIEVDSSDDRIIRIRTFERGLECESNACGTGIAAAALSLFTFADILPPFSFLTRSNDKIIIDFSTEGNRVFEEKKVLLIGEAIEVYRGILISKDLSCEQ